MIDRIIQFLRAKGISEATIYSTGQCALRDCGTGLCLPPGGLEEIIRGWEISNADRHLIRATLENAAFNAVDGPTHTKLVELLKRLE